MFPLLDIIRKSECCCLPGYWRWDNRLMMRSLMPSSPGLRSLVNVVLREILIEHTYTCEIQETCKTWWITR